MKHYMTAILLIVGLSRHSHAQTVLTLTEESPRPQNRHSETNLVARNMVTRQANVSYTAAASVTLQPGFTAQAGSVFSASISSKFSEWHDSPANQLTVGAYPNPFRQETRIEYVLPRSSQVQGVLTNSQGQVVRQSTHELQEKGTHYLDLSGSGLPAGTYMYQIMTGTEQKTVRLVKTDL